MSISLFPVVNTSAAIAVNDTTILNIDNTGVRSSDIFYSNAKVVNFNHTIAADTNAMSAGTVAIGTDITVTIKEGATLTNNRAANDMASFSHMVVMEVAI